MSLVSPILLDRILGSCVRHRRIRRDMRVRTVWSGRQACDNTRTAVSQLTYLGHIMGAMFFANRQPIESIGRSGEIRTPDPLLPKQVRYQAALRSARPWVCALPRTPARDRTASLAAFGAYRREARRRQGTFGCLRATPLSPYAQPPRHRQQLNCRVTPVLRLDVCVAERAHKSDKMRPPAGASIYNANSPPARGPARMGMVCRT
jgi:hypothetical protein